MAARSRSSSERVATANSLKDPALDAEPRYAAGSRVRVPFDRLLHAGLVKSVDHQRVFTVQFDDGELCDDVEESELRPEPLSDEPVHKGSSWTGEAPEKAIPPSPEQEHALPSHALRRPPTKLPAETTSKALQPGGECHCGGDLSFPNLTLAHPELGHKMPLFLMAPGAVATFAGATLCHGTTAHHAENERRCDCKAHISFAVQTPAATLGVENASAERHAQHAAMLKAGHCDAHSSPQWQQPGTVWLPVWHFPEVAAPLGLLTYSDSRMCVLPWRRIVLYDVETDLPLVLYDLEGGLQAPEQEVARSHFAFLHDDWRFSLNRQSDSGAGSSGCLFLDTQGGQRMEMLGIHSRRRNANKPPERRRPWVKVANPSGDLDSYVVHMDQPRFGGPEVKRLWNAMSERMHALLPRASAAMVGALSKAKLRERLYSTEAGDVLSDDLLLNNVGVSAAYQSPPHFDTGDVGWTFAFAVKCTCAFHCQRGRKLNEETKVVLETSAPVQGDRLFGLDYTVLGKRNGPG